MELLFICRQRRHTGDAAEHSVNWGEWPTRYRPVADVISATDLRAQAAEAVEFARETEIAVAPLLEYLRTPLTVDETLRAWSQRTHANHALEILGWLWDNGVIVEVS